MAQLATISTAYHIRNRHIERIHLGQVYHLGCHGRYCISYYSLG